MAARGLQSLNLKGDQERMILERVLALLVWSLVVDRRQSGDDGLDLVCRLYCTLAFAQGSISDWRFIQ